MAVEERRGCGYRKVGGLYLEGGCIGVECDRLPYMLETCPVCGGGVKLGRGFTRIIPQRLFGNHDTEDMAVCTDTRRPCVMCDPPDEVAYIMLVGEKFYRTPADFLNEAERMGVSKRIAFIPREFEVGKTIIYLAHLRANEVKEHPAMQEAMSILAEAEEGPEHSGVQTRLLEAEKVKRVPGIFSAFIPRQITKLVWESELEGEAGKELRESLEKRGITVKAIPDGDPDHAPNGGEDE